ncbi:hypothetical protein D3C73_1390590 [compost metagenome]
MADALIFWPLSFTLPALQASVAKLRVLNNLMAHKYLSILSFSVSDIEVQKYVIRLIAVLVNCINWLIAMLVNCINWLIG